MILYSYFFFLFWVLGSWALAGWVYECCKGGRHHSYANHDHFEKVMVIRRGAWELEERLAGEQLCEGPGDSGGQQTVLEPVVCPCAQERGMVC